MNNSYILRCNKCNKKFIVNNEDEYKNVLQHLKAHSLLNPFRR